jgi:hypothetical protein
VRRHQAAEAERVLRYCVNGAPASSLTVQFWPATLCLVVYMRTKSRSLRSLRLTALWLTIPQGDALPLSREACCLLADNSERPMLFALSQPGAQW